jgi:hypothetical protein
MSLTHSKHGSDESNDDLHLSSPSPSPTVSFPPVRQQGPGIRFEQEQRDPLLESLGTPAEALLFDVNSLAMATPLGLTRYLEYSKVSAEAANQVSQYGLTGAQWVGVYGRGEAAAAVAMMMGDFPALPSLRARVLVWEAQEALKSMDAATEIDYAKRIAAAASPVKPSASKEEQYSKRPKVETAPKLWQPANKVMYTCSEVSTIFTKLVLWLGAKSAGLAKGMLQIQCETLVNQSDVSALKAALPEACCLLDEELAAELVGHLPRCLEPEIVKIKSNHMVDGKASSLRIMQAIKNRVERKTKSRGSALLYKLMGRVPCKATQELQGELTALSEEYEQLERMGCTPADQDAIMHPALVRVMSALEQDSSVGATVLAKMAAVEQSDPGDSSALREVLDLLAAEWMVDYADLQGPTVKHHDAARPSFGPRSNGTQAAVMGAGPFNTPCFQYREQGVCITPGCPHIHEGRTGIQCVDSQYESTGLCSQFKRCLAVHKYDQAKFGLLKDAWEKFPGASPERMALKYAEAMMLARVQ